MKVVFDGGYVVDEGTGSDFVLVTPYNEEDLKDLRFSQSGDILFITAQKKDIYPPKALKRLANDDWVLEDISFEPVLAPPTNVVVTVTSGGTGKEWSYKITSITSDGDESRPTNEYSVDGPLDSAADKIVDITWDPVTDAERYFVYKKQGGYWGYVGQSDSTSFTDDYIAPDMSKTPPTRVDPFEVDLGGGTVTNYYPKLSFF